MVRMKWKNVELGVGGTILFYLSFLFGTALLLFGVIVSGITQRMILASDIAHIRDKGITLAHMVQDGNPEKLKKIKNISGAIDVMFITEKGMRGINNIQKKAEELLIKRCRASSGTTVKREGRYFEVFHVYPRNKNCLLILFRKNGEVFSLLPQIAIITIAFLIVFIPFGYWFIRSNVVVPIRNFYKAVEELATGKENVRAPLQGPKEIKYLANRFNRTVEELTHKKEELKRMVDELEKVNENLKRAQQEIIQAEKFAVAGRLASSIAHEIGNPVNTIYMLLELLKETRDEKKKVEYIDRIKGEVERIERFTRSLLDLSRPLQLEIKKTNLQEIVKRAMEIVFMKKMRGIDTELILSSIPETETDPSMLMQVFINILLNARDAVMEKGEGKITLTIREEGNEIIVEVADTGTGIDDEILPNIFEPFFTTKPREKGTGLGLTISQRIIRELGGRIEVESKKGEGSTFRIFIPRGSHLPSS